MIIPAAGKGKRMGASLNKQYLKLKGRPLLTYTLELFLGLSPAQIVVVVSEGEKEIFQQHVLKPLNSPEVQVVVGGKTRQDSVYCGLKVLAETLKYVCIHDGARPLVSSQMVEEVFWACQEVGGAAAGVPLKDTIKEIDCSGFVIHTPRREGLIAIQTPQIFCRNFILEAYEKAAEEGFYATDDTSLLEKYGKKVKIVPGSYDNLKITTSEDLLLAELILDRIQRTIDCIPRKGKRRS